MHELTTHAQLEATVGKPSPLVQMKAIDRLDPGALTWLAASPIMIASLALGGNVDIVFGGGVPGWASGQGGRLMLPVNGLDGAELLCVGAGFGSTFLVPSCNEVVRVNGRVASADRTSICVDVDECYMHCGKALIRSEFWAASPLDLAGTTVEEVVASCRFIGLATSDGATHADLSPKGDPAGLMVKMAGGNLWFADRPGNKRIDSFRNIVVQPRVAAVLLVPGASDVVLARGNARISDDLTERERFAVGDKVPELVTMIDDCILERRKSDALARAATWPVSPSPPGLSAGKIAAGHLRLAKGISAKLVGVAMSVPGLVERELAEDYKKNLY